MPCYHPIRAYRTESGVSFKKCLDYTDINLPCGRCIGCRLERSRQWAVRLMHEDRLHDESSFITLTYDDESLPPGGTLVKKHFQDFMKRLRRRVPQKVRFFHAGEYGEKFLRPHYHAIVFGEGFRDCVPFSETTSPNGDKTWESECLNDLWRYGKSLVGGVTFESCAYVARYVTKKITGRNAKQAYERVDEVSGEVHSVLPEYATMSRRPGLGSGYIESFSKEVYPADECIVRGSKCKPARFYDRYLERVDKELYKYVKDQREIAQSLVPAERRSDRHLEVKETVKMAQIRALNRRYENGEA